MKCKKTMIWNALFLMALLGFSIDGNAQRVKHDKQKEKQWQSMENGPWDFAPDWYYYFLHKKYSGAEMYWKWAGFKSGWRVRFKEPKSNIKRIMPVRVLSEETQRQKVDKVEDERKYVEELYKEELLREADRSVDLTYASYKDEFNRMIWRLPRNRLRSFLQPVFYLCQTQIDRFSSASKNYIHLFKFMLLYIRNHEIS